MEQEFVQASAPLPLKPRSGMEIFDVSIKLYRRCYPPLLSWSAIAQVIAALGFVTQAAGFLGFFMRPFIVGSSACAIAAAVRGQKVGFGQCGKFTKPRYWAILGNQLLAYLVGGILLLGAVIVGTVIESAAYFLLFKSLDPTLQFVAIFVNIILVVSLFLFACTLFLAWHALVGVVVCMEPDKANSGSLRRAYDLLHGHWIRLASLTAVVGLAMGVLELILLAAAFSLVGFAQIKNLMSGRTDISSFLPMLVAVGLCSSFLTLFYEPLIYLITTIFYLDLRVRKEALDLEWSDHASTPVGAAADLGAAGLRPDFAAGAVHAWASSTPTTGAGHGAPTGFASPGGANCVNCGTPIAIGARVCPVCNAAQP